MTTTSVSEETAAGGSAACGTEARLDAACAAGRVGAVPAGSVAGGCRGAVEVPPAIALTLKRQEFGMEVL